MAYSDEVRRKVLEEIKVKKTVAEVAEKYNISPATIYRWENSILRARTIPKKFKKVRVGKPKIYSDEEKATILEKIEEGILIKRISEDYNIPLATIYRWRSKTIKELSKGMDANVAHKLIMDGLEQKLQQKEMNMTQTLQYDDGRA